MQSTCVKGPIASTLGNRFPEQSLKCLTNSWNFGGHKPQERRAHDPSLLNAALCQPNLCCATFCVQRLLMQKDSLGSVQRTELSEGAKPEKTSLCCTVQVSGA